MPLSAQGQYEKSDSKAIAIAKSWFSYVHIWWLQRLKGTTSAVELIQNYTPAHDLESKKKSCAFIDTKCEAKQRYQLSSFPSNDDSLLFQALMLLLIYFSIF